MPSGRLEVLDNHPLGDATGVGRAGLARARVRGPGAGGDATRRLQLALFLVLLSCFIVFVSLSSFDEARVSEALDGIESTFATRGVVTTELLTRQHRQGAGGPDLANRLAAISGNRVEVIRASMPGSPEAFEVRFERAMLEGRDRAYFVGELAAVAADAAGGDGYRLTLWAAPQSWPEAPSEVLDLLTALLDELAAAGAPRERLAIGWRDDAGTDYLLGFRARGDAMEPRP